MRNMVLARLFGRKPFLHEGYALYGAAVAAAREPALYTDYAAPDTLAGRFDLVSLHVGLLVTRIRRDDDPAAKDLAQAVFDAMFNDMDLNLREMGVGDLAVGKRVKRMWEAFHGRALACEEALAAADDTALQALILRNLFAAEAPEDATAVPRLAQRVRVLAAALAAQPIAALKQGQVEYPAP
jgi:cytochrome b pre-mRNA-processing protein 3